MNTRSGSKRSANAGAVARGNPNKKTKDEAPSCGLQVIPTEKCLVVPRFGTLFRILTTSSSSGGDHPLTIIPAPEPRKFYALFTEDDVDFKIEVDNSLCKDRDVRVDLTVLKETAGFVIGRRNQADLETLASGGRKFHFVSQNTLEGQVSVGLHAIKHGESLATASASVSQIGFRVNYTEPEKPRAPRPKIVTVETADTFTINVKTMTGQTISIRVSAEDTVELLKLKIEDTEGTPPDQLRLVYDGKQMEDQQILGFYGIQNKSTLHMVLRLRGGGLDPTLVKLLVGEDGKCSKRSDLPAGILAIVAERGACVWGSRSKQEFRKCSFKKDPSVLVEDFVVELRRGSAFKMGKPI